MQKRNALSNTLSSTIVPSRPLCAIVIGAFLLSVAFQSQAILQEEMATIDSAQGISSDVLSDVVSDVSNEQTALSMEIASYNKAKVKSRLPPKYPTQASRKSLEGFATFSFAVSKEGEVKDVKVIDSSGLREFEQEGLIALKRWEYHPATFDGVPVESFNYQVQLDFILGGKKVGPNRRFKVRLDAANDALRANDLNETKRLIKELDKRKKLNNMELFMFAMLEADYAKVSNNLLMEKYAFADVYRHLTRKGTDEKYRSYATQRMFGLYIDAHEYYAAKKVYEKALETSTDDVLLTEIKQIVDQIDALVASGKPIERKGIIRGKRLWNHVLSYNQFSIVDLVGDINELQIRCDLKVIVYDFKPDNTWKIPSNMGKCSVLIEGENDTSFSLLETRA